MDQLRTAFETELSSEWKINDPKLFQRNSKGRYGFSSVERQWTYYQIRYAADNLKKEVMKFLTELLHKFNK